MRKNIATAVVMTAFYGISNIAMADEGPQKPLKGSTCWVRSGATNRTSPKLHCDALGEVTIPELYQKGFRVAAVYTDSIEPPFQIFVIEEQR